MSRRARAKFSRLKRRMKIKSEDSLTTFVKTSGVLGNPVDASQKHFSKTTCWQAL